MSFNREATELKLQFKLPISHVIAISNLIWKLSMYSVTKHLPPVPSVIDQQIECERSMISRREPYLLASD